MHKIAIMLLLVVATAMLIVFGQAHSKSLILRSERESIWERFLETTVEKRSVDSRDYWKMREFGMPGGMRFAENGFSNDVGKELLRDSGVELHEGRVKMTFLSKRGDDFLSFDGLTDAESVDELVVAGQIEESEIYCQSNSLVAYRSNSQRVIVLVLPIEEMKKANGLFNYDHKREVFEGLSWYSVSVLYDEPV